jgi:hypothetical protein
VRVSIAPQAARVNATMARLPAYQSKAKDIREQMARIEQRTAALKTRGAELAAQMSEQQRAEYLVWRISICFLKPSHLLLSPHSPFYFSPFAQFYRLLVFARTGLSQKPRGIAGATIVHRWRIESALMSRRQQRNPMLVYVMKSNPKSTCK